jgi:hypothetical protein
VCVSRCDDAAHSICSLCNSHMVQFYHIGFCVNNVSVYILFTTQIHALSRSTRVALRYSVSVWRAASSTGMHTARLEMAPSSETSMSSPSSMVYVWQSQEFSRRPWNACGSNGEKLFRRLEFSGSVCQDLATSSHAAWGRATIQNNNMRPDIRKSAAIGISRSVDTERRW